MKITHTAQTVATIALGRVFSMQLMYFRRIANSKEPKQKGQALSATSFTNYFCPAVKKKKKKTQVDFSSKADWTTKPTKMSMRENEKMKMLITVRTAQNLGITSAIPFSSMAKTTGTGLTTQMAMR